MTCKFCGCTDERACPGGCFWVFSDPPICSDCAISAFVGAALDLGEKERKEVTAALFEAGCQIDDGEAPESELPKLWVPGDGDHFLNI